MSSRAPWAMKVDEPVVALLVTGLCDSVDHSHYLNLTSVLHRNVYLYRYCPVRLYTVSHSIVFFFVFFFVLFLYFFLFFFFFFFFFFSSRRRHTRCSRDWSSDVCSSD